MDEIDWDLLSNVLAAIEGDLSELTFLSEQDMERAKISWLTFGLLKDDVRDEIAAGAIYISAQDGKTRLSLIIALAYGASRSLGGRDILPSFITEYLHNEEMDLLIAQESIQRKKVTTEFILSWGRLLAAHGAWQTLSADSTKQLEVLRSLEIGRENNRYIKEYWFAHWIRQQAPTLNRDAQNRAQEQLTQLCIAIGDGTVEPWKPYPQIWFSQMLSPDRKTLSKRYLEISDENILAMCKHDLITPAVLPPLSRQGFIQAN